MSSRALIALAALAGALLGPVVASAVFTASSENPQPLSAAHVRDYVDLFSYGNDPWSLTAVSYAARQGCPTTPRAATGTDENVVVNLGSRGRNMTGTAVRAFTTRVAPALPAGVSAVNVTLSTLPDAQGRNVIPSATWSTQANTGASQTVSGLAAGTAGQVNIAYDTRPLPNNTSTQATLRLTVTYSGETSGFLRYSIPVSISSRNVGCS